VYKNNRGENTPYSCIPWDLSVTIEFQGFSHQLIRTRTRTGNLICIRTFEGLNNLVLMSFEDHPLRCLGWATVRQGGLGTGRRKEEVRWGSPFIVSHPAYLPKMDYPPSPAPSLIILCHMISQKTLHEWFERNFIAVIILILWNEICRISDTSSQNKKVD